MQVFIPLAIIFYVVRKYYLVASREVCGCTL